MYNTNSSRNPWGNQRRNDIDNSIEGLKKSIREQKILLDAAGANYSQDDGDIEELKRRITSVTQEIHEKQQTSSSRGRSTLTSAQWWSRYQLNLRQLEDIDVQKQTLVKEINYLVGTSIRNLEQEIQQETEKLNLAKSSAVQIRRAATSFDQPGMTEPERIRAKAQAMVAARLGKNNSSSTSLYSEHNEDDDAISRQRTAEINRLMYRVRQIKREVETIVDSELALDLQAGSRELKDRQRFEHGLYVDDEVARLIDKLDRMYAKSKPPPPPPALSYYSQTPPPIPTSQRPGTPRSEADIKAEAHKRIEERRLYFMKDATKHHADTAVSITISQGNNTRSIAQDNNISDEEKAAQERMRQAEIDARARLESMREKRNKLRQEAAEAEEKKKKAAAEASAVAEAEMFAEKQRKQQEEEERLARIKLAQDELAEQQRQQREAELERLRKEREAKEKIETEERKKRDEEERAAEEIRQRKARKAAEQAAHEKRLRRVEIERREKELEVARLEEINRRKQWEEVEQQKRLQEEQRIREKKEEAARIKRQLDEEDERAEEKRRLEEEERKRLEEEERKRIEAEAELKKREEEERIQEQKRKEVEALRQAELNLQEEQRLEDIRIQNELTAATYASSPVNTYSQLQCTTAGTSGYGVDIEDEVNFSTIYRVTTLYEYHGMREDDLSFAANETLKAHPSKDKGSDWWYGTSLLTNQVGFFPRTYVEVVEEAFRVKTLYGFTKTRPDDLEFSENEVIIVQPFQDESSDWWYGTNEDTEESGYFPKAYVERIDSADHHISPSSTSMSIAIGSSSQYGFLDVPDELPRGLSAPNTPIMKKTNLSIDKLQVTKRRRAASNVSTSNNSHIGTPQLLFPRSGSVSENLELLTWASTMDEIELNAIPPEERKRQEAIFELIATEKSYLNDLQMIINVFYSDSAKYLSQDERDVVFSNIDDLLMCNTALLSDMESRQKENGNVIDKIGDIFLKHADGLQCYSTYCRNQSYAFKFLQKKREEDQWFEVFLKTAQTRVECRSLDLSHFLLQPVQRITRYPLLFRQILNCTLKKHADYALVRSALSMAQKVLEEVNEETRRFENIQKMSELSRLLDMEATGRLNIPGREFVMDGAFFKAKSGRKLHGFLFNDILILAEPLKSLSQEGYLYTLYREPMPIERVSVRQQQSMTLKPSFGSSASSEDLSFQIVSGSQVIAVKTATASQKRQWMSQIQHYSALQQYKY